MSLLAITADNNAPPSYYQSRSRKGGAGATGAREAIAASERSYGGYQRGANYTTGKARAISRGAGACQTGTCGGSSTEVTQLRVEQVLREFPGGKQMNLRFTNPKTGGSEKPDRETFKFLLDRGYRPKQDKGSSSAQRSYVWRKKGFSNEVSPTTTTYLSGRSDRYVMAKGKK